MSVNHVETLSEYTKFLTDNPAETEGLFKDLLIDVTQFFRDEAAFDAPRKLLVDLLSAKRDGDTVRAWTAGCSTGEESYSLAILLHEIADQLGRYLEIQVFGTDIDPEAIVTARAGIYPVTAAQDLSEERLRRFFVRTDGQLQIKKEIREKLVFAVQDITNDPPFSRMDLISVRNLLIYLGADQQRRLIPVLHYSLIPRGILLLGTAESPGEYAEYFDTLDSTWKVYGKRGTDDMRIPLPPHAGWREFGIPHAARSAELFAGASAEKALLRALGPTVLVDGAFRVVHVHGETSRFLELAQGEPNMSIVDLVRPELRGAVSAALLEAGTQRKSITRDGIRMKREGTTFLASVTVKLVEGMPERRGFAVVSFSETADIPPRRKGDGEKARGDSRLRLLETSREELQSVNEELLTVNNEYQNKIDELSVMNDDMTNLLNSSNIASILDSLIPYRQEARTRDGHWYSVRLHPYRTTADAIGGVVLSFVDINDYISDKGATLGRLKVADEFSLRLASHPETPVLVLDADLRVVALNDAFRGLGRRWVRADGHNVRRDDGQTVFRYLAPALEPSSP